MSTSERAGLSRGEIFAGLRKTSTGVVCDALGRLGLSGSIGGIHPVRRESKLVGRARTAWFAAKRGTGRSTQNTYSIIRSLEPGDVLVIGTEGCESWIFGENVATAAVVQGLAGIVTDACARDGAALSVHPLPCFVSGLSTRPPATIELVDVDVAINLAGAQVRPNDFLIGDADGIVVVPGESAAEVLVQTEDLDYLEGLQMKAIEERVSLLQLMEILAKKKVKK
jgi:regulator of RNase E activity RraA